MILWVLYFLSVISGNNVDHFIFASMDNVLLIKNGFQHYKS
jgi:hypothetical protein